MLKYASKLKKKKCFTLTYFDKNLKKECLFSLPSMWFINRTLFGRIWITWNKLVSTLVLRSTVCVYLLLSKPIRYRLLDLLHIQRSYKALRDNISPSSRPFSLFRSYAKRICRCGGDRSVPIEFLERIATERRIPVQTFTIISQSCLYRYIRILLNSRFIL